MTIDRQFGPSKSISELSRRAWISLLASPAALRLLRAEGEAPPDLYVPPLSGHAPGNYGLAITPDAATAYISFSLDDALLEVDLSAWAVRAAIDVSPAGMMLGSNSLCLSADGRWLLMANQGTRNVLVVDTKARRAETVLALSPGFGDCLRATGDGRGFLIAGRDGSLYLFSVSDFSSRKLASPSGMPLVRFIETSPVSPDTVYCVGELRTSQYHDQALAIYRLSDQSLQAVLPLAGEIWSPGWQLRMRCGAATPALYFGTKHGGDRGIGGLSVVDLGKLQVVSTTEVENGVADFVLCEDLGKIYAVGFWSGGGSPGQMPLIEWDLASRSISRRTTLTTASDLRAIARHPQRRQSVLVTEGDRDELWQVDVTTGARTGRLAFASAGAGPRSFIPAGKRTYVVCSDGSVRVFDWETFSVRTAFRSPTGLGAVRGGAYHNDLLYFVGNDRACAVWPALGTTVRTFPLETRVNTTCPSVTSTQLVCIDYLPGGMTGSRLLVFDLADFRLARQVTLYSEPHGDKVIVSPDGAKAYVPSGAMSGPARVTIYDTASWEVRRVLEIPPSGNPPYGASSFSDAEFDEDRRLVYLLGFGSLFRIHMDTDELLANDNLMDLLRATDRDGGWSPTGLAGIVLSADKSRLSVAAGDSHCLYTFDCRAGAWLPRILNLRGYFVTDACASPDRRYLLTSNALSGTLTLVDTQCAQAVGLFDLNAGSQARLLPFNLVNAAGVQPGPVAPGEIVSLFGLRIGPDDPAGPRVGADGRIATGADGARVFFDGVPAPILYAGENQINAVVPYGVASRDRCRVWAETPGGATNSIEAGVVRTAPALFTIDSSGAGQAVIQHEDGSLNAPGHPARRGSVITLWGTGCGETVPPGVDGALTAVPLPRPVESIQVEVGGQPAEVLYAGGSPNMVAGLLQINVRIPASAPTGAAVPLSVIAGNARSPVGITLAVA